MHNKGNALKLMCAAMPCMATILLCACGGGSGGSSGNSTPSPTTYQVSATAGAGGSISPASATVDVGGTTQFTVTANSGYGVGNVTGCGGTLSGITYTTGTVNANCTVSASFLMQTLPIDATALQINPMHNGTVTFSSVTFPPAPTWSVNVDGTPSYALIADGLVYITVQLSSSGYPNYSSELLALDQKTGASGNYTGVTLDAASGSTVGSFSADYPPAVTATTGYFLQGGVLRGLSTSNNTIEWSFTGDGSLTGPPLAVNQYVIIGSSAGDLYAVNGATGAQVWTQQLGAAVDAQTATLPMSTLAAGDGLLVVPAGTEVIAYTLASNP